MVNQSGQCNSVRPASSNGSVASTRIYITLMFGVYISHTFLLPLPFHSRPRPLSLSTTLSQISLSTATAPARARGRGVQRRRPHGGGGWRVAAPPRPHGRRSLATTRGRIQRWCARSAGCQRGRAAAGWPAWRPVQRRWLGGP